MGRNGQRQPSQGVTARKESKPNFRSFPARQNTGRVSQATTTTTRPTPRQRFEARPTVLPTQQDFAPTQLFQGFDFTTHTSQPNQFNLLNNLFQLLNYLRLLLLFSHNQPLSLRKSPYKDNSFKLILNQFCRKIHSIS